LGTATDNDVDVDVDRHWNRRADGGIHASQAKKELIATIGMIFVVHMVQLISEYEPSFQDGMNNNEN
jgi:hypothetical protein